MATGLPWPGELDALKKGVGRLIGNIIEEPEVEFDPNVLIEQAAAA